MNETAVRLSVRGTLGTLKVQATAGGRVQRITLGVHMPRRAPDERLFAMKAAVASDVGAFAVKAAATGGSIAVGDIELRTLIRAELLRECGNQVDLAPQRGSNRSGPTRSREMKMADFTTVIEFKSLNEELIVAHKAFLARLRAEAPALLDDYTEIAAVTRRVLMSALCLETGEAPTELKTEDTDV